MAFAHHHGGLAAEGCRPGVRDAHHGPPSWPPGSGQFAGKKGLGSAIRALWGPEWPRLHFNGGHKYYPNGAWPSPLARQPPSTEAAASSGRPRFARPAVRGQVQRRSPLGISSNASNLHKVVGNEVRFASETRNSDFIVSP
jgi:hypothetical protein